MRKLTPQELREQFDQDVERFSNIQAGQNSIMDSVLVSDLMEKAIKAMHPDDVLQVQAAAHTALV